ncbi:MAG TPA: long-chain fatty acid--CoA ligase [Polyangiaceae bacterium]
MNTKAPMRELPMTHAAMAESVPPRGDETLPELFFRRVRQRRAAPALRRKRFGLWEEISWQRYEEAVRSLAAGLIDAGVKPGDRVGLISENRVEWLVSDLGILSAGGVTCAMYTTSAAEQIAYIVRHSGARVVVAENEEQLDKLLPLLEARDIDRVIVIDPKGLRNFRREGVVSWEEFQAHASELAEADPGRIESAWSVRGPDDLAILVYTSGTTGPPKGVMLSHRNIVWACRCLDGVLAPTDTDEYLSFLPLCHIAERTITVFNQVVNGSVVSFAETLDTVRDNLAEVRPHVFFAVPRIWEKLYNAVELKMRDSAWSKRRAYTWALEVGRLAAEARQRAADAGASSEPTGALGFQHAVADVAVLRPLREKLGLDRVRYALSGAAPISPEVIAFFQAIGVPLVEGYGMTESTAIISTNSVGFQPPGTVGRPVPGLEVKLADDGEILVRSPGVMLGYFGDDAATQEALAEGYLHTGDIGEFDAHGRLRITDRKKDLIITAGGKNIAPQYIESKLRMSPYVHDAVVVGDRRKYITALVILDEDNLVAWAQAQRVQFGAYAELARSDAVTKLIGDEVETVNATLTHVEAVKQFRVLDRPLSRDEGELTPTLKVRRNIVEKKYQALIDAMYR